MPTVPPIKDPQAKAGPMANVSPENVLMAAATMHEMGRLIGGTNPNPPKSVTKKVLR